MTGFDLILWRRGLNWTQERAAAELGISRTSLVNMRTVDGTPDHTTCHRRADAESEWPTKTMSKDRLLRQLKYGAEDR